MPTENSVITREHLPGLLLARTIWENGGPSLYFPPALQDATDQARAALPAPASVPDGYMPIPTAEQLADALENVRCFHDLGAELIAPELLANLLAAPTIKAEQVQCEVCHGQGEVYSGHDQHFHYFDFQPPEPIMEVCPECGGEEAPSLPAAGSADLTAVRCQCCAAEYPHDSYDAGFIAGSGMCQVCDAAMPPKDLPAAGSAVEEVEVVAWVTPEKDRAITATTEAAAREDGGAMLSSVRPYSVPCMTVAQCLRMLDQLRAALSAQQSDPWAPSDADYDRAIHRNPDAKAWADFFVSTFPGLADKHELMIGWFANAMMAMHDHLKAQQPEFCPGGKWHGKFVAQQSAHVSVPKREALSNLTRDGELIASGWNACLDEFHKLNPGAGRASGLLGWAVSRWEAEVSLRPLHNVHRRSLDDTWRQVIRRLGGNDHELCGPPHDALLNGGEA